MIGKRRKRRCRRWRCVLIAGLSRSRPRGWAPKPCKSIEGQTLHGSERRIGRKSVEVGSDTGTMLTFWRREVQTSLSEREVQVEGKGRAPRHPAADLGHRAARPDVAGDERTPRTDEVRAHAKVGYKPTPIRSRSILARFPLKRTTPSSCWQ